MALLEVGTGQPYTVAQNAINAAANGDHVRLNRGGVGNVYDEKLSVVDKRLRLTGCGVNPADGMPLITVHSPDTTAALGVGGSGGVHVENLAFLVTGIPASFVVELNVAEDWISRCVADGNSTGACFQAQFADNCLAKNGTYGLLPSCGGQVLLHNLTCVNQSLAGLSGNAGSGSFVQCLAIACNNLGLVNQLAQYSVNNITDDPTALSAPGGLQLSLADVAFLNYAGGDFRLAEASLAFLPGLGMTPQTLDGRRRAKETLPFPRAYAGCFTPYPFAPTFLSGASQIRRY